MPMQSPHHNIAPQRNLPRRRARKRRKRRHLKSRNPPRSFLSLLRCMALDVHSLHVFGFRGHFCRCPIQISTTLVLWASFLQAPEGDAILSLSSFRSCVHQACGYCLCVVFVRQRVRAIPIVALFLPKLSHLKQKRVRPVGWPLSQVCPAIRSRVRGANNQELT